MKRACTPCYSRLQAENGHRCREIQLCAASAKRPTSCCLREEIRVERGATLEKLRSKTVIDGKLPIFIQRLYRQCEIGGFCVMCG